MAMSFCPFSTKFTAAFKDAAPLPMTIVFNENNGMEMLFILICDFCICDPYFILANYLNYHYAVYSEICIVQQ